MDCLIFLVMSWQLVGLPSLAQSVKICLQCRLGLIPGLGRSLERAATPPVFLPGEESIGRGAWWADPYGVPRDQTRLRE